MLKSELINLSFSELRISGITVDPSPEDYTVALRELDQMMRAWRGKRREVNYNFPAPTPNQELVISDPDEVLGVYDWAEQGVTTSLAIALVSHFGKDVPPALAAKNRGAVNVIRQNTLRMTKTPMPNRMPIGSGNLTMRPAHFWRYYYPSYTGRAVERPILLTQILDCQQDFSNFVPEGDSILSYTIAEDPDGGVRLLSDFQTGNVISFRVEAYRERDGHVDIEITTVNGLVMPQRVCFNTEPVECPSRI